MALYATPSELASYLQMDLDTSSATLALTLASGEFAGAADTAFSATTVTYSVRGGPGTCLELPYKPVTAVSAVRLNGVTITGWTLRLNALYRQTGFGASWSYLPDQIDVDLTHGYTTVPDDVKLAVLEIAGAMYEHPSTAVSETIDDYSVKYNGVPIYPGRPWRDVAASYRGVLVA